MVRSRLDDSLRLLEETTRQVRTVMAELRPPMLDDYGLLPALRWQLEQFSARTGIASRLDGDQSAPRLARSVELTQFRICQEALNNVAKHAGASEVTVVLRNSERRVAPDRRGQWPWVQPARSHESLQRGPLGTLDNAGTCPVRRRQRRCDLRSGKRRARHLDRTARVGQVDDPLTPVLTNCLALI